MEHRHTHITVHTDTIHFLSYFLHKHQMKETKNSQALQWGHMGVCNGQTDFALTLTKA